MRVPPDLIIGSVTLFAPLVLTGVPALGVGVIAAIFTFQKRWIFPIAVIGNLVAIIAWTIIYGELIDHGQPFKTCSYECEGQFEMFLFWVVGCLTWTTVYTPLAALRCWLAADAEVPTQPSHDDE